jgi:hypothetical protein
MKKTPCSCHALVSTKQDNAKQKTRPKTTQVTNQILNPSSAAAYVVALVEFLGVSSLVFISTTRSSVLVGSLAQKGWVRTSSLSLRSCKTLGNVHHLLLPQLSICAVG